MSKQTLIDRAVLALVDRRIRQIQIEMLAKLKEAKRTCSPGFAERLETHMRNNDLLPPNDDVRQ